MDLSDVDLDLVNRKIGCRTEAMSVEEVLLAFIAKQQLQARTALDRIESQIRDLDQMATAGMTSLNNNLRSIDRKLRVAESDLDVPLGKLIDLRSGQAVIALREILDELRLDDRDDLIQGILDEAVEEGLLDRDAGLPAGWEPEAEEPEPPAGEREDVPEHLDHWPPQTPESYSADFLKKMDLEKARTQRQLWRGAVVAIRNDLRRAGAVDPWREEIRERGGFPSNLHMTFGMQVRNGLRDAGYGEEEFGICNLENIYQELFEEAVGYHGNREREA